MGFQTPGNKAIVVDVTPPVEGEADQEGDSAPEDAEEKEGKGDDSSQVPARQSDPGDSGVVEIEPLPEGSGDNLIGDEARPSGLPEIEADLPTMANVRAWLHAFIHAGVDLNGLPLPPPWWQEVDPA